MTQRPRPPWWWRSETAGDDAIGCGGSRLFGEAAAVIRLSVASWSWPSHIMKFGPVRI